MKKNFTSTLIMAGVLVALSAWYVLYEQKYKPDQKEKEEQTKKLVSLEEEQISEFKLTKLKNPPSETSPTPVTNPEYESIELKKTGKDWFVTSPIQTKGDATAISSLLSSVCSAKQERVVDEKAKDLSVFGLKDPLLKISLKKDANSPAQEVWVGVNTPVSYSVYAKTASSESVFKTSRALKTSLEKDLFALRDKYIVNLKKDELSEVEIQNPSENIVLKKEEGSRKDNWILSRENIPAEFLEWSKTLTPLIELKATKVPAENNAKLEAFGLSHPWAKVTFVKTDKSRQIVRFGKTKEGLFAKREDLETIFEVDKTLEDKIKTKSSQYRNKHLAQFDRYEISRIRVDRGDHSLELLKGENSAWTLTQDTGAKIDSAQVDGLLTKLQDLQITKYLTESSKSPLSSPALKISLFEKNDKSEKEVVSLAFAKSSTTQVKGQRSDLPLLFELSKDDFNKINITKQSFLKTEEKPKEAPKLQKKS